MIKDPKPSSFNTCEKKVYTYKYTYFKWHMAHDTLYIIGEKLHVTNEIWHMTHDRWGAVNLLSKCQLPSSSVLGLKVFGRYFHKEWLNEWMTSWGLARFWPHTVATRLLFVDIWKLQIYFKKHVLVYPYEVTKH